MAMTESEQLQVEELQLATRNHGMPLEALRYDVTPIGLHYLLIHYDIPALDPAGWRLRIDGSVHQPVELTLDELKARPAVTRTVTMECAGNGRARLRPRPLSQPWLHEAVGTGSWTGTPLRGLLEDAGLSAAAKEVVFTGSDHGLEGGVEQVYQRSLTLSDALADDVLLAYELNGVPLPPQHGAPLRLVVPGWYGMTNVKWLAAITVTEEPFEGYQQQRAYRFRQQPDELGQPVKRMRVRSLMMPPGIPDFYSRRRVIDAGPCLVSGRAWSGAGPIETVEVSTDDGATWQPADLEAPQDPTAWTAWRFLWTAEPGEHVLCCRATDATGDIQPSQPDWNLGGYAVNAVHRIEVQVR